MKNNMPQPPSARIVTGSLIKGENERPGTAENRPKSTGFESVDRVAIKA